MKALTGTGGETGCTLVGGGVKIGASSDGGLTGGEVGDVLVLGESF
jgi:hypothetical protein